MRRHMAGLREHHRAVRRTGRAAAGAALAAAVAAAVLAGCGSGPAAGAGATASPGTTGSQRQAAGRPATNPMAASHLRILTTLDRAQLCSVLSAAQAQKIMGVVIETPQYGTAGKLGIFCRWIRRGTAGLGPDELYLGISTVADWAAAEQVDKLIQARPVTVDGHPALAAGPLRTMTWAQVDVALGGPDDPVAEFRGPAMAMAMAMARDATEQVLARG
jgi:hypothetical protein